MARKPRVLWVCPLDYNREYCAYERKRDELLAFVEDRAVDEFVVEQGNCLRRV